MEYYRGWKITYNPHLPVTGQWRAERFGVGMCNNSKKSICRMVDFKVENAQNPPTWRACK